MTFLIIAIPIMILAVALAAVPLLVLTAREHRMRALEVPVRQENRVRTGPPL